MHRNLYESFKRWFHNDRGQVFFYSDPHFGDNQCSEFRKKHGMYVSDDEQIKRINSKIGKYDTIVFLGDIGNVYSITDIRGYKVLLLGNHDRGITNYRRDVKSLPTAAKMNVIYDNKLFDEVYEGCLMISDKIILSHEPVNFPYALNIHGHKHDLPHRYDQLHVNVCAEAINFTPVSLKQIIKKGFTGVKNIHDECIHKRK